jgi:hypothetical protein
MDLDLDYDASWRAPVNFNLEYNINHVFLPPKLPHMNDTTTAFELGLTKAINDALKSFIDLLPEEGDWKVLPPMLEILLDDGVLESPVAILSDKLGNMNEGGLCFQNCCYCRSFY